MVLPIISSMAVAIVDLVPVRLFQRNALQQSVQMSIMIGNGSIRVRSFDSEVCRAVAYRTLLSATTPSAGRCIQIRGNCKTPKKQSHLVFASDFKVSISWSRFYCLNGVLRSLPLQNS